MPFNPWQELPPEYDTGPITVPVSPNQVGGFVGKPQQDDPSQAAAELEAARSRSLAAAQKQREFNAAHAGQLGISAGASQPIEPLPTVDTPPPSNDVAAAPIPSPVPEAPAIAAPTPQSVPVAPRVPSAGPSSAPSGTPGAAPSTLGSVGDLSKPPANAEEAAARLYAAGKADIDAGKDVVKNAQEQSTIKTKNANDLADASAIQAEQTRIQQDKQRTAMEAAYKERDKLQQSQKDFKYHNFWDTKTTGQEIMAGIGILLGGFSWESKHVNESLNIIDKAVTREWTQQEAELAKRTALAQQAGLNIVDLRASHDFESGQLKLKQASQLGAIRDQLEARLADAKGRADVTAAQKLEADLRTAQEQLGAQGLKLIADSHEARSKLETEKSIRAKNYAEAGHARALRDAAGGKVSLRDEAAAAKEVAKIDTEISRNVIGRDASKPGSAVIVDKIQSLKQELDAAEKSGDGKRIKAAVTAIKESSGSILSGGKTTNYQGKIIGDAKTLQDKIDEQIGAMTGNTTEGKRYVKALGSLLNGMEETHLKDVDKHRTYAVQKLEGPGGAASTPRTKAKADNLMTSWFGSVRNPDGTPRYQEGGATPNAPAATPTAGGPRAYSPHDDEALAWANANPKDPRAASIHQRQGR